VWTPHYPKISQFSHQFHELLILLSQQLLHLSLSTLNSELRNFENRAAMVASPSLLRFHSAFLGSQQKLISPSSSQQYNSRRNQRSSPASYPCVRADLDQNTIVAISVGVVSVAVGIGIPVFYETQIDSAAKRENTQPCFPCTGSVSCRFCTGAGTVTVELGGGETEVSKCINCDGAGTLTCTTCQGSGVQPRYLDRREFKDDD
ncbi:hypothetical protein V2J09_017160, partial [Rumex salicifolius]